MLTVTGHLLSWWHENLPSPRRRKAEEKSKNNCVQREVLITLGWVVQPWFFKRFLPLWVVYRRLSRTSLFSCALLVIFISAQQEYSVQQGMVRSKKGQLKHLPPVKTTYIYGKYGNFEKKYSYVVQLWDTKCLMHCFHTLVLVVLVLFNCTLRLAQKKKSLLKYIRNGTCTICEGPGML